MKKVHYVKGSQRYLFRYQDGQEAQIVNRLLQLARDDDSQLGYLDVAMLSFQVARRAALSCRQTLTARSP